MQAVDLDNHLLDRGDARPTFVYVLTAIPSDLTIRVLQLLVEYVPAVDQIEGAAP